MLKVNYLTAVISLILVLVSFYGGMQYQKFQTIASITSFSRQPGNTNGTQNRQRLTGGFRPVAGEILTANDTSLTVKLTDGSSKIIILSTAPITNTAQATKADLKVGTKVMVVGTENSDGSITAISLQLNPSERFFGRPSEAIRPSQP